MNIIGEIRENSPPPNLLTMWQCNKKKEREREREREKKRRQRRRQRRRDIM